MARRKQSSDIIAGLDIGTSKIAAVIAKVRPDRTLEVVGFGTAPSRGLNKGVVSDIDKTVDAIERAVDEAERMSGIEIESVYVGIAGSHIHSENSHGMVAIRGQEVTGEDVQRVIEAAKTVPISSDRRILHIIPQSYMLDGQPGIHQPVGMSGVRLEAQVHLITGSVSAVQNITKCVERCGLQVADIVLEQLASAEAVLQDEEKELGVCLVDIGGGTTDIALYYRGAIQHTGVIDVAGTQVTNDIAQGLRTPMPAAEEIKRRWGVCLSTLVSDKEEIEVPSVGDRPARCMSRSTLAAIIEPRYEELFQLIAQDHLHKGGFQNLTAAGVVLTGGSSRILGAVELAEEVFHMPVRLGVPQGVEGVADNLHQPEYATTVGLLRYGLRQQRKPSATSGGMEFSDVRNLFDRMKRWFKNSF